MKKRDYLSPHTWQQTKMSELDASSSAGYSKFGIKGPIKMGRYLAVLFLAGIVFFLTFHHSKNSPATLTVASVGPTIQTITLPPLAHHSSTTLSAVKTA